MVNFCILIEEMWIFFFLIKLSTRNGLIRHPYYLLLGLGFHMMKTEVTTESC